MNSAPRQRYVLFAVLAYVLLALAWIFLSDQLLAAFIDIRSVVWLSTAKGVFFVLVSATVFYFVLSGVPPNAGTSQAATDVLLDSVASRPWSRWLAYGFAVGMVMLTVVVRSQLSPEFGNRPLLILFMLPIMLAAMLGGFGPGLVATLAAAVASSYFMSAAGRMHTASAADLFHWALLLVNGLTASLVSEAMHRLWRQERTRRTQLDHANANLKQGEARFRQMFQEAPVAISLARLDGTILDQNARFEQLFGYTLADVPDIDSWWPRAYPDPDYRAQVQRFWHAALARLGEDRKTIEAGEYRIRCKDGSDRVVRITTLVMPEGLLSTFTDLTDIRRAEQAVTEAETAARRSLEERQQALEILAAIVAATDDAIFAKDREGRYLLFNRAASQFVGKPAESVLGRDDRDLFPPDQAEMLMAAGRQVMRQEQPLTQEEALDTADGPRVFLATKGPLRDAAGQVIGIFGISRDITEQKRSEREQQAEQNAALARQDRARLALLNQMQDANEARRKAELALASLSESEERLRLALGAASQGLYDLDLVTGETVVTPEYARMLGYAPETFHETHAAWRGRLHPDDVQVVTRRYEDYIAGRTSEYRVEFRQRTLAGDWKWILSLGKIQTWDAAGRPLRMLGTHTDIDQIKQAESAIRSLNATLEARVAERTAELGALNQSLESFVYSVSHDLKTPLRGVEGYSRLLLEDYAAQLDDEGRLFLNNIRAGIARMNELIDDLLAYSRMERRKLDAAPLDLAELVQAVLAERAADIAARGTRVEAVLPPLHVHGDADGLAMVLRNLLENALKFSGHAAQPQIELGARAEAGGVTLWIRDNGVGFDMKFHDRIFEIFQRLHRLEDYPGTGIGLALVKKAMQRMGGRVWAESAPDAGATFYLWLPG